MNIKADFASSLVTPPQLPPHFDAEDFLGRIYTEESDNQSPLFQLLSGGTVKVSFPFSFSIHSMDCFMLLYTLEGCGKLLINHQVYSLTPSTLLLLDCREPFRLDIAIDPWKYQVFFITGSSLPFYYHLLPERKPILTTLTEYCETALCLNRLLSFTDIESTFTKLTISNQLDTILTHCITGQLAHPSSQIPSYLTEMKELFDESFEKEYTLDDLAKQFNVSKYRLCREFGNAFGMPPVQYLNHRRIQIATQLLLTTDLKIHEVGSKVGIDNTNHFISQFRKIHKTTPLEYKQRMTH